MSACPDKLLLVHGLADGELDAANILAAEAHIAGCDGCRAEHERILALRGAIAEAGAGYETPPALARRIEAMLALEGAAAEARTPEVVVAAPRRRGIAGHALDARWWTGAVTGLAAGLALMVLLPRQAEVPPPNEDALLASHLRSLLPGHELDVPSSDRHVVKPWFAGRIEFAPPAPDLSAEGFPLSGGRLDYVEDRKVAALVYRRRRHVINVFVGKADEASREAAQQASKDGYNIVRWRSGDLEFAAVSDLNAKELAQFRALFIERTKG
jgi:anti-sigma factor RsiW